MPKVSKILLSAVLGVSSLALLILIGVIVWGFIEFSPSQFHGTVISPPKPAIDFALHSDTGLVHLSNLKGKVVMLYFGYTFCPDHCPLTLSKIKIAISDLSSKETDQVRFVMVTVDPERDNVKKITNYVRSVRPDFIGLTGTPAEIDDAAKKYAIYYKKHKVDSAAVYLVDHTTSILVLDKQGRLCLIWSGTIEPNYMTSDLKTLVARK